MPKVSVIIPTYNRRAMLLQAVATVLAQTYSDFEIIIVDDGSTDDTKASVESLGDPRIRYVWQENQERSAARNNGVSCASGEYVAFLDSDDVWFPEKLQRQMPLFERFPDAGLAYCYCARINTDAGFEYPIDLMRPDTGAALQDLSEDLLKGNCVLTPAVVVRADLFLKVGGFDTSLRLAEDWDLWIRLAKECKFCFLPETLAAYRVHEQNSVKELDNLLSSDVVVLERYAGKLDETRHDHTRLLARLCLRNAFAAAFAGSAESEKWFAQARRYAIQGGVPSADIERLMLTHCVGAATYSADGRLQAANVLREAVRAFNQDNSYLHETPCMAEFWTHWSHTCYQLQDYGAALECVRQLIRAGGLACLDRGLASVALRSAIRSLRNMNQGRARFPIEDQLPAILDTLAADSRTPAGMSQ